MNLELLFAKAMLFRQSVEMEILRQENQVLRDRLREAEESHENLTARVIAENVN